MTSHPPEPPAQWPPPSPEEARHGREPASRSPGGMAGRAPSAVPGGPAGQRPPGGSHLPGQRDAPAAGGLPAGDRLPACARPSSRGRFRAGRLPGPARLPPGHLLPAGHLLLGLPVDARLSAHAGLPGRGRLPAGRLSSQRIPGPALTRPMATRPRPTRRRASRRAATRRADPRWWSSRRPAAAGRSRPPRSLTRSTSTPAAWPPPARMRSGHARRPPGRAQPRPLRRPGAAASTGRRLGHARLPHGAVLRLPGAAGRLPGVPAPVTLAPGARGPGGQRLAHRACTNCPPRSSARCWCSIPPGSR